MICRSAWLSRAAHQEGAPCRGALAPVAAVTSSHQVLPVGCLWFTRCLSGAWQERNGDHVCEKRRSGLDLLGCGPGPGYPAWGFKRRESEMAYRSLLLRDGVRAAPSSSAVVCRIVGAPPLCAPARVLPGRTLWKGEGRVGSRASPQSQVTPSGCWWWLQEVPVPALNLAVLRTAWLISGRSLQPPGEARFMKPHCPP
jgi:hypothetical protein